MVRNITGKSGSLRTVVRPFETTVGKSRRKIVPDAIELADLGCHAFKTSMPASVSVRFAIPTK